MLGPQNKGTLEGQGHVNIDPKSNGFEPGYMFLNIIGIPPRTQVNPNKPQNINNLQPIREIMNMNKERTPIQTRRKWILRGVEALKDKQITIKDPRAQVQHSSKVLGVVEDNAEQGIQNLTNSNPPRSSKNLSKGALERLKMQHPTIVPKALIPG
ncbi:hypothetical protein Salat_0693600 [Sesamum alatum]|uniref:Uncharacterized protein n=1 Tax=Sesamum alatum TaxID=300844 RepID=A0AAE2CUS7_9LAMI|nr:hypothetical protein Salat_0693600 [Sesamum alatum]